MGRFTGGRGAKQFRMLFVLDLRVKLLYATYLMININCHRSLTHAATSGGRPLRSGRGSLDGAWPAKIKSYERTRQLIEKTGDQSLARDASVSPVSGYRYYFQCVII